MSYPLEKGRYVNIIKVSDKNDKESREYKIDTLKQNANRTFEIDRKTSDGFVIFNLAYIWYEEEIEATKYKIDRPDDNKVYKKYLISYPQTNKPSGYFN